jgi:hypothetical protein
MQFVAKLMEADLSEVQRGTRSNAYWPAMRLRAIPELILRCWAVLMALASTVAVGLVAVLSIGCYGAAKLLGKVRPLRDAYQFLSRTYDRLLERLGQKILRDTRDTPALRLMVSLSLTALPIFVVQLILGKPRLLLAVASIFRCTASSLSGS